MMKKKMGEADQKASTPVVPRFASFKPRQTPTEVTKKSTSTSAESSSKRLEPGKGHHTGARRLEHSSRSHGQDGRDETTKSRDAGTARVSEQGSGLSSRLDSRRDNEDVDQFLEDRLGDDDNSRYGTPNRYTIPKVHEAGRHRLLGLSRFYKTGQELKPGRRLVVTELAGSKARYTETSLRKVWSKDLSSSRVVASVNHDTEADILRDYIPLSPERSRKRRKLNLSKLNVNPGAECSYDGPSDLESDSSVGSQDDEILASELATPTKDDTSSTREHSVYLSHAVEENPADVNAWMALIQHQGSTLSEGAGGYRALTRAEQRGLADIRLSMYEKALSKTKGHPLQDQLVQGMMNEAAKMWDTKKLAEKWKSILKEHPESLRVWVQYLNFQQTNFVTFTYEGCRAVFQDCLDIIATKAVSTDAARTHIYVFLRMTVFMRQAGFSEHAHALWQAILEKSFFAPDASQAGGEISSFEDFWDSELPRLGELGARGWTHSQRVDAEPRRDPDDLMLANRNLYAMWGANERRRMESAVFPARTFDEVDEDDPYRVILFSDIQPFLFRPPNQQAREPLLNAFLCFCGLPPANLGDRSTSLGFEDQFLSNSTLDGRLLDFGSWQTGTQEDGPFAFAAPSFVIDTLTLFTDGTHWCSPWKAVQPILSNKLRSGWIQRSLRQLCAAVPTNEHFYEYAIAFQSQIDLTEAQKHAKTLLKRKPSIRLYNAFAFLEHKAGKMAAAERVWSMALSMKSSFSPTSQQDTILIWRSWLWALVDQGDLSRALRVTLAVPDEEIKLEELSESGPFYLEEHPISKIRALQHLEQFLNQSLSLNDPDRSIHFLDVLALSTYLTTNRTLPSALARYTTTSTHPTIIHSPRALTLLHQSRARLLHLHATSASSGYRPSDITRPLRESLRLFPDNSIFLSLYHFHTRRSLLMDRVREVIPTLAGSTDRRPTSPSDAEIGSESITRALFHIWLELNQPTFTGTTVHSIRAAFEKAVTPTTEAHQGGPAHSPILWTLYILWEVKVHVASSSRQHGQMTSKRLQPWQSAPQEGKAVAAAAAAAIATFHRACRACPWAKEVYMLAFEVAELREAMTEAELRAVYEMLAEDKGVRVHLDLERIKNHA